MALKLPENPTDEQRKAIATAVIRQAFEDDAVLTTEIESLPGNGWKVRYKSGSREFNLEYQRGAFKKWPVGVAMDDEGEDIDDEE